MSWEYEFDDPLSLPNGGQALTLREAGQYIVTLSSTETFEPHWQNAIRLLLEAAASQTPVTRAFRVIQQALRASQANEPRSVFKSPNDMCNKTSSANNSRDFQILL